MVVLLLLPLTIFTQEICSFLIDFKSSLYNKDINHLCIIIVYIFSFASLVCSLHLGLLYNGFDAQKLKFYIIKHINHFFCGFFHGFYAQKVFPQSNFNEIATYIFFYLPSNSATTFYPCLSFFQSVQNLLLVWCEASTYMISDDPLSQSFPQHHW